MTGQQERSEQPNNSMNLSKSAPASTAAFAGYAQRSADQRSEARCEECP